MPRLRRQERRRSPRRDGHCARQSRDRPAPWAYAISDTLVNPRVTGWVDNLLNYHPARYLCFAGAKGH
jgi:hypothetical protein